MTFTAPGSVLDKVRSHFVRVTIAGVATLFWTTATALAQSQDKAFSGLYVGVDAGRQHLIGGSLVEGVDTLHEDSRAVVSFFGGLRAQFRGFAFGGELGAGRTDGDLLLSEPSRSLTVDYQNNSQRYWALNGGYTITRQTLLFGYLSEVTRGFDVTIRLGGTTASQRDEQGLLRFGGGVEQRIARPVHLRVTLGTARADFGGRPTNIDVGRRLDAAVGVAYQF